VLPSTKRAVTGAGMQEQFDYLPGDLFRLDLPENEYDLIVLAQVCHLFDEPGRGPPWSCSPGRSPLVVCCDSGQLPGSPGTATQELSLLLQTTAGTVHSPEEQLRWFEAANLRSDKRVDIHSVPG